MSNTEDRELREILGSTIKPGVRFNIPNPAEIYIAGIDEAVTAIKEKYFPKEKLASEYVSREEADRYASNAVEIAKLTKDMEFEQRVRNGEYVTKEYFQEQMRGMLTREEAVEIAKSCFKLGDGWQNHFDRLEEAFKKEEK